MSKISEYIESGILELYILGIASIQESKEVEEMASKYPEIKQELESIRNSIEFYTELHTVDPPITIKPFLLATIDYTERMKSGETPSFPSVLNEQSTIENYSQWLNRKDMVIPESFDGLFAKIIGYTPEMTTAIVWIKEMAPQEVHDHEYEKFLIVEGTCDIIVGEEVNHLVEGNYFSIPLHSNHMVKVTSKIPCKVILQRVAA